MGSRSMNQQIPPPPPGFELIGAGSPPPAPAPARPQAQPRPAPAPVRQYAGPLPTDPRAVFPALVAQESGGRAGVLGPMTDYGQAQGRTQMLPATAQEMAGKLGLPWRPELMTGQTPEAAAYQDRLGLAYLEQGLAETGNMRDALRYYHGGPDRDLWGPKTQAYSEEVLARIGEAGPSAPQPHVPSPPPGFEIVADEARGGLTGGEGVAVTAGSGMPREWFIANGIPLDATTEDFLALGWVPKPDTNEWTKGTPDQIAEVRARMEREANPQYQAEYAAASAGAENIPPWILNLAQGGTLGSMDEILGGINWLAPMTEGIDRGLASQAGRDAVRDREAALFQDDPVGTGGMQLLGGLLTPGLKGSGEYISGATGAARTGRAAVVGAGYGAAAGAAGAEGGAQDRAAGGLLGAGVGATTGGLLDAGARRAVAGATRRTENPSPQRLLSREGVQLTPGQMLEPTPVIGGILRRTEDAATSIPIAGPSIQAAKTRGVESFNIAALNRALAPIGQRLPRDARPGYGAVEDVQSRLGRAYDDILPQINAQLDRPLYDDIARVLDDAASEMPRDRLQQLVAVLQNRVFRNVEESDATISGEQFKRIESELGALARQYRTANDPSTVSFGEAVTGVQNALREMIARQNPQQAARIRQINEGYANLVRIERAAGGTAAQATDGVFSPTQLGVATNVGTARGTRARGGGLLQDLAASGRQVLPSTVNNSGTMDRAGVIGLLAGGAAVVNPVVTVPTIALTAGAYTKPAQAALNAIYRATDRRSATSALAELQRFAGRNPALQQYYQAAAEYVLSLAPSRSQEPAPAASGLLSPTAP